jgi:transglutaminase-like putative cysteine protease
MYYSIRHVTKFRYGASISQSIMEVRMQPRTEGSQRCVNFSLHTSPRARVMAYRDDMGNIVHHFDVPGRHTHLTITAQALVEMNSAPAYPEALGADAWDELDRLTADDSYYDFLAPSTYAQPSAALRGLARDLRLRRGHDPLSAVRALNTAIYDHFDYAPQSTRVDSPIEEAITAGRGVCQDFAHVMLALLRELGVPARYVSGYLFHRSGTSDRSAVDATHAWVEALMPQLGWVGFDPTNNLLAGDRHIRAAIGRDYADVPPTHGVYKGRAESDLSVAVQVTPSEAPPPEEEPAQVIGWVPAPANVADEQEQQQQQQQ